MNTTVMALPSKPMILDQVFLILTWHYVMGTAQPIPLGLVYQE
jgi:hypothetical protein